MTALLNFPMGARAPLAVLSHPADWPSSGRPGLLKLQESLPTPPPLQVQPRPRK